MKAHSVGTFVQVGMRAINLALVEEIEILSESIHLYYRNRRNSTDIPVVLVGDEHTAFLDWWEHKAKVTQTRQSHCIVFESGATLVYNGAGDPEDAWRGANIDLTYFADQEENNDDSP